jgi:predicted nuclease of predicted toxin-antitoxin system
MADAGTHGCDLNNRFLIDECLSSGLVAAAKARGFEADHLTHIGKAGWQDWNLVRFAVANDYIIVTANRRDFLKEYAKLDVHSGLVVVIPMAKRAEQIALFSKALDVLAERNDDLFNQLVEVLPDGSIHFREWSADDHDVGHINKPKWT